MSWTRDGIDDSNSVSFVRYKCSCGRQMVTCGSPPATPCICSVQPQRKMGKVRR